MENKIDSILSKLKKMKKLYESAKAINSEGEANAAAAAIQRLLTQYNLSMDEIDTATEERNDAIEEEATSGNTYKSIGGIWEYRLLSTICKYNFCQCFLVGGTYKKLLLIGKKENLETVKWLREMLSERFVAFSKQRYKEYKNSFEYKLNPIGIDTYQRNYLCGCVIGLEEKLKEESEKNKVEEPKITDIVLRNDAAINEYVKNKYKVVNTRKSKSSGWNSAKDKGYYDGKNTDLHKPVKSGCKELC